MPCAFMNNSSDDLHSRSPCNARRLSPSSYAFAQITVASSTNDSARRMSALGSVAVS